MFKKVDKNIRIQVQIKVKIGLLQSELIGSSAWVAQK